MSLSHALLNTISLFKPALPVSKGFLAKIGAIHERWPDVVQEVPERNRELVLRKLAGYVESWEWDGVKMSLVCSGAPLVFDNAFRDREEFAALQIFYLKETIVTDSPVFISAMVSAFIRSYEPGAAHTKKLSHCLDLAKENMGDKWLNIIEALPELLNPETSHHALALKMMDMQSPWKELKKFGITRPHDPGLMNHAHLAYIALLAPDLHDRLAIEKLFTWLKPEGRDGALMAGAAETISALLTPWIRNQPEEDLSRFLTEKLVELYGDPRLGLGGVWGSVDKVYRNVIIRWLTRENILFFLNVVSDVEDSHMWEPRRDFWLGLYNEGIISSAWVAFSPEACERAEALKKTTGQGHVLNFGKQIARGRGNTSLLILQIGQCIVVEGSHSYRVQMFKAGGKNTPVLFEESYDCEEIRLSPDVIEAITHRPEGTWQNKVKEQLGYLS